MTDRHKKFHSSYTSEDYFHYKQLLTYSYQSFNSPLASNRLWFEKKERKCLYLGEGIFSQGPCFKGGKRRNKPQLPQASVKEWLFFLTAFVNAIGLIFLPVVDITFFQFSSLTTKLGEFWIKNIFSRDTGIGHLTKNYLRPIFLLPKKTSLRKVHLLV